MQFFFSRVYRRQYKKLPRDMQEKVYARLQLFAADETHPLLDTHALHGEWQGYGSINITGDYRVIYRKVDETLVRIEAVGTHAELYGA